MHVYAARMVKAVFIESSHSHYRDEPGRVYHFPNSYLSRVEQAVGDWVIFYEGRRGAGKGYHRVQRLQNIVPDPADNTHSYAVMETASELDFETNLARVRPDGRLWETGLARMGGNNTSAVRLISDDDFAAIINAGLSFDTEPDTLPRAPLPNNAGGFAEDQTAWVPALASDRTRVLTSRPLRDAAFSRNVRRAYRGRCAISGLELRNGGGRPEVEAAHIRPVEHDGPDTVRNGLALSGTVHWMFDRGLLSIDEDHSILIARDSIADETVHRLINGSGKLIQPSSSALRPHEVYLDWHRRHTFKG